MTDQLEEQLIPKLREIQALGEIVASLGQVEEGARIEPHTLRYLGGKITTQALDVIECVTDCAEGSGSP